MTTRKPASTKTRPLVGPLLIVLGFVTVGVHLAISPEGRFPHMTPLLDAVTGYPAAALLFIFGVILTQHPPHTRSRAPRASTHHSERTTPVNQPQDTPNTIPNTTSNTTSNTTDLVPQEDQVLYEERLYPSIGIWVITAGLSTVPAVIFAPIDMLISVLASALTLGVLVFALLASTPTIRVTQAELRVGRATIERQYVGRAQGFIGENATAQRGTRLHGLAYLCIRGWIDGVVRIELSDKEDKTPYWLVSSRQPKQLSHVLNETKA